MSRQVARVHHLAGVAPAIERCHLRQRLQIGFLEHQADVRVRDQRAGGVDHVSQTALPDLDARDHVPYELQVQVGHRDAAIAPRGPRDRHV
ncbi:MAG TPA: hypothetical protein VGJ35_12565, partial [Burkholderiaceae bacterium]